MNSPNTLAYVWYKTKAKEGNETTSAATLNKKRGIGRGQPRERLRTTMSPAAASGTGDYDHDATDTHQNTSVSSSVNHSVRTENTVTIGGTTGPSAGDDNINRLLATGWETQSNMTEETVSVVTDIDSGPGMSNLMSVIEELKRIKRGKDSGNHLQQQQEQQWLTKERERLDRKYKKLEKNEIELHKKRSQCKELAFALSKERFEIQKERQDFEDKKQQFEKELESDIEIIEKCEKEKQELLSDLEEQTISMGKEKTERRLVVQRAIRAMSEIQLIADKLHSLAIDCCNALQEFINENDD